MNKYESVVILKSNLSKTNLKEILKKIKNKINENFKITKIDELGIRKLAYEIKNNKQGYYVCYEFETDKKEYSVSEIERFYRIKDEIIKFIIIKRD